LITINEHSWIVETSIPDIPH